VLTGRRAPARDLADDRGRGLREGSRASYAAALPPLIVGSTGFFASVAICLAISHGATTEHDGISYFSVRSTTQTALLGYLCVITGMLAAMRRLTDHELGNRVGLPMRCMPVAVHRGALHAVQQGHLVQPDAHDGRRDAGDSPKASSRSRSARCSPRSASSPRAGLELLGGIISAMSLPDTAFNFLLQAELLLNLGFYLCLIAVVHDATAAPLASDTLAWSEW
jgi:hypothetical protein